MKADTQLAMNMSSITQLALPLIQVGRPIPFEPSMQNNKTLSAQHPLLIRVTAYKNTEHIISTPGCTGIQR